MRLAADLLADLDVSRETVDRLQAFSDLVSKWNPKINLVSQASIADIMRRHIADSAQLFSVPEYPVDHWVDLGSGGGFPGIVIAALGQDRGGIGTVTLVESDVRKCVFLREAIRTLSLRAKVINDRIESVGPLSADVVSARALAPLKALIGHAQRHMKPSGLAIFPKGARYREEVEQAVEFWSFDLDTRASLTDSGARILVLRSISSKPTAGKQ